MIVGCLENASPSRMNIKSCARAICPSTLLLLAKNGIKVEGCFAASLLVFASEAEAEGALRWLMA